MEIYCAVKVFLFRARGDFISKKCSYNRLPSLRVRYFTRTASRRFGKRATRMSGMERQLESHAVDESTMRFQSSRSTTLVERAAEGTKRGEEEWVSLGRGEGRWAGATPRIRGIPAAVRTQSRLVLIYSRYTRIPLMHASNCARGSCGRACISGQFDWNFSQHRIQLLAAPSPPLMRDVIKKGSSRLTKWAWDITFLNAHWISYFLCALASRKEVSRLYISERSQTIH